MKQLYVKVINATNLIAVDGGKSSDPYCILECGKEEAKTNIVYKNLNPQWNAEFILGINQRIDENMTLKITVKDYNTFTRDVLLGVVYIPLSMLSAETVESRSFPLTMAEGMIKVTGEIILSIHFVDKDDVRQPIPTSVLVIPKEEGKVEETPVSAVQEVLSPSKQKISKLLKSGVSLSEETSAPNYLIVTIIQAKDLLAADGSGSNATSDPLVKIKCGKQIEKTFTVKKSLNPSWSQKFAFDLLRADTLELMVEDEDMVTNDFLGRLIINVKEWLDQNKGASTRNWYPLVGRRGEKASTDGSTFGEIELQIQAVFIDCTLDEFEQGELASDGAVEDEEADKETEEQKKKREEEQRKLLEELNEVEIKSGDYQIQVHIIEVRDLKAEDLNGTSDPVVFVTCLGQKQHTVIKRNQTSCVFDELFFFNVKGLDRDDVESGFVHIGVFDADGPAALQMVPGLKNDLIGSYQVDLPFIYYKKNHELYRQWVALVDESKMGECSIAGYLKMSITVLGPGDKLKVHNLDKELEVESKLDTLNGVSSLVLMPPRVQQTLNFLVITIHKAEDLPQMDCTLVTQGGIDAYVRVDFAGNQPLKTKVVSIKGDTFLSADFNQQLWLPVMTPTMTSHIGISVWDNDLTSDELVATAEGLKFDQILKHPTLFESIWVNLYGAPLVGTIMEGKTSALMNKHPNLATTYRGRLLVSLRIETESRLAEREVAHVKRAPKAKLPATTEYTIRAFILTGTEIPEFLSRSNWGHNSKMQIKVCIGSYTLMTSRSPNKNGMVRWVEYLHGDRLKFPDNVAFIPDIFIYLVRQSGSKHKNICYIRYKASELIKNGFKTSPKWLTFKGDKAIDELNDGTFPGSILAQIAFGTTEESIKAGPWDTGIVERLAPYKLFVHVYQARNLPPADANGLLDPYIKVLCCGQKKKIEKKMKTRDPCYYETVGFDVELPRAEYMPEVAIQVWDWDQWDPDDYAGTVKLPLSQAIVKSPPRTPDGAYVGEPPRPAWYPVFFQEPGDSEGELLLSYELFRKDVPDQVINPPATIAPKTEQKYIEIIALGLRGLKAVNSLPINMPFAEFSLNDAKSEFTKRSKTPLSTDPNFLERIVMPVKLPIDALFAPTLNIKVYDYLLGGFCKPMIGSASLQLLSKLPMSCGQPNPRYKPPRGSHRKGNPNVNEIPDESHFPGVKSRLHEDMEAQGHVAADMAQGEKKMLYDRMESKKLRQSGSLDKPTDALDSFYDDEPPAYIRNRRRIEGAYEEEYPWAPFETISLFHGQKLGRNPMGLTLKSNYQSVGKFKGLIRVISRSDEEPLINLSLFLTPQPYLVRVYVLEGTGFQPMDSNGKSDPYLVVSLGKEKINDQKNYIKETLNPKFHKLYELKAMLPGASDLRIQAYDYDMLSTDDYIGETVIDLEDRWFDDGWQVLGQEHMTDDRFAVKPIEERPLWCATSTAPQGTLSMWVEVLTTAEAVKYKAEDVSLPPEEEFEVRVVIWKTRDVVPGDEFSGLSDLYIKCWLEGCDPQETDTHWRCKDGKGSFNWRMKFPVILPMSKEGGSYLRFQMWDKDLIYNDCLGDASITLSDAFRKAYKTKQPVRLYETTKQCKPRGGTQSRIQSTATVDSDVATSPGGSHPAESFGNAEVGEYVPLLDEQKAKPKPRKETKKDPKKEGAESMIASLKNLMGLGDDPSDSSWLTLHMAGKKAGDILLSVEVLPKKISDARAAGLGRSEPNNFPVLPEPTGRLNLSAMWNPFYVFEALVGPRAYNACTSFLCCAMIIAILVFGGPLINVLLTTAMMFPPPYGWVFLGSLAGLILLTCCYCSWRCQKAINSDANTGSKDRVAPADVI